MIDERRERVRKAVHDYFNDPALGGTWTEYGVADAAFTAMPQPAEVSDEDVALVVAQALCTGFFSVGSDRPKEKRMMTQGGKVARAIRAAGYRIVKGEA